MILMKVGHHQRIRVGDEVLPTVGQLHKWIGVLVRRVPNGETGVGRIEHGVDQEPKTAE